MSETDKHRITRLLMGVNEGEDGAEEKLIDLIYLKLRQMARRIIYSKGRADPTFQTTELVHEAYMNLVGKNNHDWKNRRHFFGAASEAMRRELVRIAREINAEKRGGKHRRIPLKDWVLRYEEENGKLFDINRAIEKVYEEDRSWGQVADMHQVCGFTHEEIAKILRVSLVTVQRRWRVARAILNRELKAYKSEKSEH